MQFIKGEVPNECSFYLTFFLDLKSPKVLIIKPIFIEMVRNYKSYIKLVRHRQALPKSIFIFIMLFFVKEKGWEIEVDIIRVYFDDIIYISRLGTSVNMM